MDFQVIFQITTCSEDLLADWTDSWVGMFLISMPCEPLSPLTHKCGIRGILTGNFLDEEANWLIVIRHTHHRPFS